MTDEYNVTSESPFYKVLEAWGEEVIAHEKNMPEFCEGVTLE